MMFFRNAAIPTMLFLVLLKPNTGCPQGRPEHSMAKADSSMVSRISGYGASMAGLLDGVHTNMYIRYSIKTERRNPTLMAIPTMFYIAQGQRENAGETYSKIHIRGRSIAEATTQVSVSTIRHNGKAMPVLLKYLMPDIYSTTMIDSQILSPLNGNNTRLYRYTVTYLTGNRAEVVFRPRRYNTQLVSGSAIADRATGRVIRIRFNGEYDMIRFSVDATMGSNGIRSMMPKTCDIDADFHFMGNRITTAYHAVYDNPVDLPDSIRGSHDMSLMDEMRPTPLPDHIRRLYNERLAAGKDTVTAAADSAEIKKQQKRFDKVLWNAVGSNLIKRINGSFGASSQGSFRISPILNPLSISYSRRKGLTYKLRVRGSYKFSKNSDIYLNFKGGYSLKQKQFYFSLPLRYTYNRKKNGYIEIEAGNGNRITNSNIVEQVKHERLDSIDWDKMSLDYFKDSYVKAVCNYDILQKWSFQPGAVFHKRTAVDSHGFNLAGRPASYYSFAPSLEVQFRPNGWQGPILTADYERGIKGIWGADMEYERVELDASWRKQLRTLRTLSLRAGGGFYTSKSDNAYFLDYTNFREENIPGGWNDDWTGEFQLLNSNWYNASEYYVRTNITYESPLMLLSRIPLAGRLIEMERIYVNTLYVERLHPYMECGYGFTNRYFSLGVFLATSNHDFKGIGCRFSFELFRDW